MKISGIGQGAVEKVIPPRFSSKNGYWIVGYKVLATWKYVWRRRESDALEVFEHLCTLRDEAKASISRQSTRLTESLLAECERMIDALNQKYGAERVEQRRLLSEAVNLFIKRTPQIDAPYLDDVVDKFLEHRKEKVTEITHRDYMRTLTKLKAAYGDTRINEVDSTAVREFFELYDNKRCKQTHIYLNAFFEWCAGKDNPYANDGRGWIERNPISWKAPNSNHNEPDVLSFTGIVNILMLVGPRNSAIEGTRGPSKYYSTKANHLIGYYLFRLFSLMRSEEYFRMVAIGGKDISKNKFIDWERKKLVLTPEVYKKRGAMSGMTHGRIFEPIHDTFWEWMSWMKEMRIPLSVPCKRKGDVELKEVCKKEKINGRNILRHTSITYHMLKFQDMPLTCKCAGTSLVMINRHYWGKNIATSDATQFYELTPKRAEEMGIIKG